MFVKLLIFSLLLPILGPPSGDPVSNDCCGPKYTLSGTIQGTYFSQGGVERENVPLIPTVLKGVTLRIIRLDDPDSLPKVVGGITSDDSGNFSIKLPAGKYGFAGKDDELVRGQCFPLSSKSGDQFSYHTTSWESEMDCPIDLTQGSVQGVVLIRHESNICGLCP